MALEGNEMTKVFKEKVDEMQSTMPVVTYLRDDALQERHWEEIMETLQRQIDIESEEFTLKSLIDMGVKKDKDKIGEIAQKAAKEAELNTQYNTVESEWKKAFFTISAYKDSKDYFIISSTEQVNELLEDSLLTLSSILGNQFAD